MIKCQMCGKDFLKKRGPGGPRKYCDKCKTISRKKIERKSHIKTRKGVKLSDLSHEEREKKRQSQRQAHLKHTYGITINQFEELLKKQEDCCGVCGKHKSEEKKNFHVDHDHRTGEIRGLLCNYCNRRVIGRLRDPELFRKAAKYLDKGTGLFVPKRKKTAKRKPKKTS